MPKEKLHTSSPAVSAGRPEEERRDLAVLESYMRDLWRFLPIPICYVNPIHKILDINSAFVELSGYVDAEVIGKEAFVLWGDREQGKEVLEELIREGSVEAELDLVRKDGGGVPVRIYGQSRKDEEGEAIGYFLAFINVTKEKKSQQELEMHVAERTKELDDTRRALLNMLEDTEEAKKRAENDRNRTQAIIANFPDGLVVLDAEERVEVVNPEAERMFGARAQALLGKMFEELSDIPSVEPLVGAFQEKEGKLSRYELQLGGQLAVEATTISLNYSEKLKGVIITLHNITREKQIERLKSEFVSLAAHQLRTPLSAIKWTLRMLLDGDVGKLTSDQRELLQKTYTSNERMIVLINDLLDVTRIEEGRFLFKPKFSHLEESIKVVVEGAKALAKQRNVTLEVRLPDERLPQVLIDSEKIQLAIQNLVENAIRYTPSGGSVTVSAEGGEEDLKCIVEDTGMGIPEQEKKRLFQKFFRASNVKRVDTEGSGLGLYITKNIVETHGGKIWFESEEKKGAKFIFTIPVKGEMEEFLKKL